jgi:phenylacetate-CoA ligase
MQYPASLISPKILLGSTFRRTLRFVSEAQHWSSGRAEQFQLELLQMVCHLAYDRTSYYRRAFDEVGFEPGDLRSLDDFARIPTIDKNTLLECLGEMCAVSPHSRGVDRVATGGTSGAPFYFYIGSDRSAVEYAYLVASWQRAGYGLDVVQAVLRGQVVRPTRSGMRHEFDRLLRRHYYSNFHTTDDDLRAYIEHMRTIGPFFLHVYPSSMAALTRFVERSGVAPPTNLRGVLAGSETVYPEDRARTERVLGVRYFSWYGHSEKLVLAAECEHCSDYHVWPTYGYCELLDEKGRRVTTPGQRGEIVGTGFINTVVPFIRYRTGDFATYVGNRCEACGREHMILRDVQGHRTQEMLVASDGSLISWTSLNMHDDTFDCVRQFQFLQETPGRAVLRVVPADGFGDSDRTRIMENLGRKLDGRLEFDVRVLDDIPVSPRGKAIYVDQRIDLSALDVGEPVAGRA